MSPMVTVLLPVHNGMPYLPEAIDSILHQTVRSLQLFILDDGSTDGSPEYAEALTDERIRVYRFPKIGLSAVLNNGIAMTATPFVARMDADDRSAHTRFQAQLQFFSEHPDVLMVGTGIRYMSQDGRTESWPMIAPGSDARIRSMIWNRQSVFFHPTIMVRTDALRRIGGYREDAFPAEDYDLYFRLLREGELANIPAPLHSMRIHGASVVSSNVIKGMNTYARLIEYYSGTKHQWWRRMYFSIDNLSLLLYRLGLIQYLNVHRIPGMVMLVMSGLVNPFRLFFFLKRAIQRMEF